MNFMKSKTLEAKKGLNTCSAYWMLFDHMLETHGLALTDGELSDIAQTVQDIQIQSDSEALNEAKKLIAEIMRGEVNPEDECEKFLRAFDPQQLFPEKGSCYRDYHKIVRKGRAKYHCRKCDADISLAMNHCTCHHPCALGGICTGCGHPIRGEDSRPAPCSALSDFIAALKKGKLQHCVHDEWNDCDLEKITIGYLLRAREFRIIEQNA